MIVEVGGVQYQSVEARKQTGAGMKSLLLMTAALSLASIGGGGYSKPAPNVNIVEEYKLILQKKSKLSKRDRDWVVYQFHRRFKKIEQNEQAA